MSIQLGLPSINQWLLSGKIAPSSIAREVINHPKTILKMTKELTSAAEFLSAKAPRLIDIMTHFEHNVGQGFMQFQNGYAMQAHALSIHRLSTLSAAEIPSAIERMVTPLAHEFEEITRLASDNLTIRREMHKLKDAARRDTDEIVPTIPAMGTAYRPCSFEENHRMEGFYSPPKVTWEERLTNEPKSVHESHR